MFIDPLQLVNNGHTGKFLYTQEIILNNTFFFIAQLNLKNHYVLKNVAPQSKDYNVEQIHFHWGHSSDLANGSEHLLNGRSYPLEVSITSFI